MQGKDRNSAGKILGFDELNITPMGKTTATAGIVPGHKGGLRYGAPTIVHTS